MCPHQDLVATSQPGEADYAILRIILISMQHNVYSGFTQPFTFKYQPETKSECVVWK